MRRLPALTLLVIILMLALVMPASAGWSWCSSDPNIKLADGGVAHLIVSVPEEYRDTPLYLAITAPDGSRIVGNTGRLDITSTLAVGPDKQISASMAGTMPVRLTLKLRGKVLGMYELDAGNRDAAWALP